MLSTKSTFDMSTTWNKLSSAKITSLAWHPDKEGILAFGTDEGRVGYLDSFSQRFVSFNELIDFLPKQ
jgi:gem associated protein 5